MIIRGGLFSACIAENDPLRFLRETYVLMKKSPGILPRGIYPLHFFFTNQVHRIKKCAIMVKHY